jgi:hypothetical protein
VRLSKSTFHAEALRGGFWIHGKFAWVNPPHRIALLADTR